jgi:hypothetical protein
MKILEKALINWIFVTKIGLCDRDQLSSPVILYSQISDEIQTGSMICRLHQQIKK